MAIMSGEARENRPYKRISTNEIIDATKRTLKQLHDSRMKSFDERVGNQPTERELAEKAMRINISMAKLSESKEKDKVEWAKNYLKRLQQNPAGRTLYNEISKKLAEEQKEKQHT